MSDKQTTAIVLLVILSLIFYLYNQGRLASVVAEITGNKVKPNDQVSINSTAAALASNQDVASANVDYSSAAGLNTGYFLNAVYGIDPQTGGASYSQSPTNTIASVATLGASLAGLVPFFS